MYLLDTNVVSELRRPRPHPCRPELDRRCAGGAALRVCRYGWGDTGGDRDHPRAGCGQGGGSGSLAGQGPGRLWRVDDGRAGFPGVGTANAQKVGRYYRRRNDCSDSHGAPDDGSHPERERLCPARPPSCRIPLTESSPHGSCCEGRPSSWTVDGLMISELSLGSACLPEDGTAIGNRGCNPHA